MGCYATPLSCLEPSNLFAGVFDRDCAGFADPSDYQAERAIFDGGFDELINNFGIEVDYYVNNFDPQSMNIVYGEHTTMYWLGPTTIKAYVQLEEESPIYALGGFDSPDTITLYLHITDFTNKFSGLSAYNGTTRVVEPKSQDKVVITALGCDRPNDRGAKIFEITEVLDQDAGQLNPVMGHYIWRLRGVRSENDFTTNEPREAENKQIADNNYFGKLSSTMFPELSSDIDDNKNYDGDVDEVVQTDIFPESTSGNDGDVYGGYY